MPAKPQGGDDDGFPTSAELSREGWDPFRKKDGSEQAVGDPWQKLREKERKDKEMREKLRKRYRDGKL